MNTAASKPKCRSTDNTCCCNEEANYRPRTELRHAVVNARRNARAALPSGGGGDRGERGEPTGGAGAGRAGAPEGRGGDRCAVQLPRGLPAPGPRASEVRKAA